MVNCTVSPAKEYINGYACERGIRKWSARIYKLFWTGFPAGELAKHFEFNPEQDIQGMMSAYISDYFEVWKIQFYS